MIKIGSLLKVADNSGVKTVKCIGIFNNKKYASLGDIITITVKSLKSQKKLHKKDKLKGLIVHTKKNYLRKNNSYIKFNQNAVVLINNQNNPISTRVIGPIIKELKIKKFLKIIALADKII